MIISGGEVLQPNSGEPLLIFAENDLQVANGNFVQISLCIEI